MTISSDEQVMNAAGNQGDWITDGFDAPQLNNNSSATEIHREGGSCMEWVLKENIGVANGEGYTSTIPATVDFTASLMKIMIGWFFTTSDADFGKLTNFRIGISSDTGFETNFLEWDASLQVTDPDRYGWIPVRAFNQNPDFTGGTFVANSVDSVGWRCSTGSLGTKLSGFDQFILISRVIGHSQTVTLQNFRDEDTTNDWGAIENYGPDFFKFSISIELGDGTSDIANTVFDITNKSVFFDNVEPGHNLGFIFVNPSSTNQLQVTFDGAVVSWNQQDSSVVQSEIFTDVNNCDIFRVSDSSLARGGRCTLSGYISDANTFFDNNVLNGCDRCDFGDFRAVGNSILSAAIGADEGAMLIDASFTTAVGARQINNSFTRGTAGHAIQLATGTPSSITLNGYRFSGYNEVSTGDNLIPNSGPADATIYNDSGGAVEIVITNGDVVLPSIRNGPGATTTVVAAVNITFTDFQANTEIRVYETGTSTQAFGVESATTPTEVAALSAGTGYDIVAILPGWQSIRRENVSFAGDQEFSLQQLVDRNFNNPP